MFVVILLLLLIVAGADAVPTLTTTNAVAPDVHTEPDTTAAIPSPFSNFVLPGNAKLANLGAEFLQLPANSTGLTYAPGSYTKSLPAVPAAILMTLTGFLCVSLVKDRRVWLAALAGLLGLGQAGIQAVPQLALYLSHRNYIKHKQQHSAELTYSYYLENSSRLRSDIEGTRYIGLLHHLAGIPQHKSILINTLPRKVNTPTNRRKRDTKILACPHRNTFLHLSAIIPGQCSLNLLSKRLASNAEQFICFSPAFVFEQLARGPPKAA